MAETKETGKYGADIASYIQQYDLGPASLSFLCFCVSHENVPLTCCLARTTCSVAADVLSFTPLLSHLWLLPKDTAL